VLDDPVRLARFASFVNAPGTPDPAIELTPTPGSDPEGNPEAESSIDTLAHEAEAALAELARRQPEDAGAQHNLGTVLLRLGRRWRRCRSRRCGSIP